MTAAARLLHDSLTVTAAMPARPPIMKLSGSERGTLGAGAGGARVEGPAGEAGATGALVDAEAMFVVGFYSWCRWREETAADSDL